MQGGVYLHQGGLNSVQNNIVVDGAQYQLSLGGFDEYGAVIERNIFAWQASSAMAIYDFDVPATHDNSTNEFVMDVIERSDYNLY